MVGAGHAFEELGFYYVGPIDGHNLDHLLPVLRRWRHGDGRAGSCRHPEGKGYGPGRGLPDKYHAWSNSTSPPAAQAKAKPNAPANPRRVRQSLARNAKDEKIGRHQPRRCRREPGSTSSPSLPRPAFDVGLPTACGTFAAGLATEGYKPFCAIYSTFLQRGYDQIVQMWRPEPAGALRIEPRRLVALTADPCRIVRTTPISAACPISSS